VHGSAPIQNHYLMFHQDRWYQTQQAIEFRAFAEFAYHKLRHVFNEADRAPDLDRRDQKVPT
jgi:hypothetical protein